MSRKPNVVVAHLAVCVSDLDRSTRFYTEALNFVFHHSVANAEPWGTLVELHPFKYRASFLDRDAFRLELFAVDSPGFMGSKERRPMNKLGMTHLSFVIDDLKAVVDRIVEYGGRAYPETQVDSAYGEIMFCTDPDGVRLELWRKAVA